MTLSVENICVSYGKDSVLKNVSTSFEAGSFHALIGPNGSGKSTLLKAIAGLLPLGSGHITGFAPDIPKAQHIAYLPQTRIAHPQMTCENIVALGREPFRRPFKGLTDLDRAAIENATLKTDIADLKNKTYGTLSGGQQARVLLARALAVQGRILIVDEPAAGLDPYYQLSILNCLKEEAKTGKVVIAALHNLSLAREFSDKIHVLNKGHLVISGDAKNCLSSDILRDVFRLQAKEGFQLFG